MNSVHKQSPVRTLQFFKTSFCCYILQLRWLKVNVSHVSKGEVVGFCYCAVFYLSETYMFDAKATNTKASMMHYMQLYPGTCTESAGDLSNKVFWNDHIYDKYIVSGLILGELLKHMHHRRQSCSRFKWRSYNTQFGWHLGVTKAITDRRAEYRDHSNPGLR